MDSTVFRREVGLADGYSLHGIVTAAVKVHQFLIQCEYPLVNLSRGRVVVAGNMVLDEFLLHSVGRQLIHSIEVEAAINRCPDGIGLRGVQNGIVARLLQ